MENVELKLARAQALIAAAERKLAEKDHALKMEKMMTARLRHVLALLRRSMESKVDDLATSP